MESRMLKNLMVVIIVFWLVLSTTNGQDIKWDKECDLIVIAEPVRIGKNPGWLSGRSIAVWWATYSIDSVLKGRPAKNEIDVAHIVLSGHELDNLKIGDKALLCLKKPTKMKRIVDTQLLKADYTSGKLLMIDCNCK